MEARFELLLSRRAERKLTRSEKREFRLLVQDSAAFRRLATRDVLIDRVLRENFKPALDPELVLQAISHGSTDLAERTMSAVQRAGPAPGVGWPKLRSQLNILSGLFGKFTAPALGLALALFATLIWWFVGHRPGPPPIGRVLVVVGSAQIRTPGKFASELKNSTPIRFGDRLETGDADKAELQFADGTTLLLGFNTIIELPKLKRTKIAYSRPPEVKLLQGQVWTKVQKSTNATPYAIGTDLATAVARGTEFGLQLRRARSTDTNSQPSTLSPQPGREAVLTVKEGIVDFYNAHGSVQATAMRESTARAGLAPTEPRRLQTLQTVHAGLGDTWEVTTSALTWPGAIDKLVGARIFTGLHLHDVTNGTRIAEVHTGTPAERAGLQTGDVLLTIDGVTFANSSGFLKQVLLSPNRAAALTIRRNNEDLTLPIELASHTNYLAPALPQDALTGLSAWLRAISPTAQPPVLASEKRLRREALQISPIGTFQAAACNNLGVLFELEDGLGPAIRSYGHAAYLQPDVPLYRCNLALALRKIGSFERSLEELEAAASLAPESALISQHIAEIQSVLGRHDEAMATLQKAINAAPNLHGLWELKAQLLLKEKRLEEARFAAVRAIELEPHCAVGHGQLAGVLHDLRQFGPAEESYRRALLFDPADAALHMNLALLLQGGGRLFEAEQGFRRAIELRPNFALGWCNLGKLLLQREQLPDAAVALRKAAELEPDHPRTYALLGAVLFKQSRFDQAEQEYRHGLQLSDDATECLYGLGEVYRQRGALAEAEKHYRRAIQVDPSFADAHTSLGVILYGRSEFDEAEKLYLKAIELDPTESAAYHNLGEIYRKVRHQLDQAELFYRRALALDPNLGASCLGLAKVMAARGDFSQAEKWIRDAIRLDPRSSSFQNELGELYRQRGDLVQAEALYRKALELDPDDINPLGNLAILHAMRRQFPEAEKILRTLLERTPNAEAAIRIPALVNLASVCGEQGKLNEAEKAFRQALVLAPNDPHVCNSFAWFLAEHRLKLDEALILTKRSVQTRPEDARVMDTLGWVQFQRGNLAEAETAFLKALELCGENPPADEIRQHLNNVREKKQNTKPQL